MRSPSTLLASLGLAVSLSIGAAGCSSEPTRDDLIGDIADELDVEESVAECFAKAYEDVGISLQEVQEIGEGDTPEGVDQAEFGQASVKALECLPEGERSDLIDGATDGDTDAARNGFISSFVATAPEGTTEEQAGCVFDELVDSGVKLSEMASSTLTDEVQAALGEAVQTCGLG